MSEPDEVPFLCIGCGTRNPVGAESCSGCGHRFGGPDAPAPVRRSTIDPYQAPETRPIPAGSWRIGTAMLLIALVAVCLGAFAAHTALGIVVGVAVVPALCRSWYVSNRRAMAGRPMGLDELTWTFVVSLSGVILIAVSSSIAFGVTCFPIGLLWFNVESGTTIGVVVLASGVGITAALVTGYFVTRRLLGYRRDRTSRTRENR